MQSLQSLISLIARRETSSGGRFQISSEMPLGPNEGRDEKGYWKLSGTVGALGQEINFSNEQEGETPEVIQRFLCHLLISGLPAQGLKEALETLADIFQFHLQSPPPAQFQLKNQGLAPQIAKVGKAIPRPELVFDG